MDKFGGASRDRTDDLIVANDALSQLSYSPTVAGCFDFTSLDAAYKARWQVIVYPRTNTLALILLIAQI